MFGWCVGFIRGRCPNDSMFIFWGTVKSEVTNLVANVASCFLGPLRFRRLFARLFIGAGIVIMSALVAVDTEFVSFGDLSLFSFDRRKCSFMSRVSSFLREVKLFVSRFVAGVSIAVTVFVVGRRMSVVGLTNL